MCSNVIDETREMDSMTPDAPSKLVQLYARTVAAEGTARGV